MEAKTLEDDAEIKLLEQRKLEALRRRLKATAAPAKKGKTDRELVEEMLYDRGEEVLEAAYGFYPRQTEAMVKELAGMIREGRLAERVSGGNSIRSSGSSGCVSGSRHRLRSRTEESS